MSMRETVFEITDSSPRDFACCVGGSVEPDNLEIGLANLGSRTVRAPWITCDANFDFFSCETLLSQILPANASPTMVVDKLIRFLAHHILHTTGSTDLAQGPAFYNLLGNPVYNLNSLGACACGHFTAAAIQLLDAFGWSELARPFTWKGHTVCLTRLPGDRRERYVLIDGDGIRRPVWSLVEPGQLADLDELQANGRNGIISTCAMSNGALVSGLPAIEYARMVDSLDDNRFYDDLSPFGALRNHTMAFDLRPGESIVRSFVNRGATTFEDGRPRALADGRPCHMYGSDDGLYPKPQYEKPHVFGNGVLRYRPLVPLDSRDEWVYEVRLPYGIVGLDVNYKSTDRAAPEIALRLGEDGSWQRSLDFGGKVFFQYQLRIRPFRPRDLCVETIFLCNPRSLPHLELGDNHIHYRDASGPEAGRRLRLTYRYIEREATVDVDRSDVVVFNERSEWSGITEARAGGNGFGLVLVSLRDLAGRPVEGAKVFLESDRGESDEIVPEATYTGICPLFDHDPSFAGRQGTLNLNTLSAPVVTINNSATLRVPVANRGLVDRTGREYLGTRLFRVHSRRPGTSTLHAYTLSPDGTKRCIHRGIQVNFRV